MPSPTPERALLWILSNPSLAVTPASPDQARALVATKLAGENYGVYIGSRPQGSEELALTIERTSGIVTQSVSDVIASRQSIMDVTTWMRADGNRVNRSTLLDFGEDIRTLIVGLRGTADGVYVGDIAVEAEPFQADEEPGDASDDWVMGYTWPYVIFTCGQVPDHRIATIGA